MPEQQKKKPSYIIWFPIVLSLVTVLGMWAGIRIGKSNWKKPAVIKTEVQGEKTRTSVDELLRFVSEQYVDTINESDLRTQAIKSILDDLDPHTYYIPADKVAEIREAMEGQLEGIGIQFMLFDDTINVLTVMQGGGAAASGIKEGDKLIAVNDSFIAGTDIKIHEIVNMIKGPAATEVEILIKRYGVDTLIRKEIERSIIQINSVPAAFRIGERTVYMKMERFTSHTTKDFIAALDSFTNSGETIDLVLDLRQNPGGYLHEAVKILSQIFEERGQLLVYTKSKDGRKDYKTSGKRVLPIAEVAVLVDEGSASASEIVAGAVQDLDRGAVIGRRTFGKGLVQEQFILSDGSALRLTTARYYTPSGRLIQRDYGDAEAYELELNKRLESGELFFRDSIILTDSSLYYSAGGRALPVGNGIIPDLFVPFDSIHLNDCSKELYNLYHRYSLAYYLKNPMEIHGPDAIVQLVDNNPEIMDGFVKLVLEKSCLSEKIIEHRKVDLRESLTAFLGKYYLGEAAYYQLMHRNDPAVKKALDYFGGKEQLEMADR